MRNDKIVNIIYRHLASNFVGIGEEDKVKRWNKKTKSYEEVIRPEIVQLYNESMGGVDLLDQLISYYRVFVKSRKWPLRVLCHFQDFSVGASWLEYKRDCKLANIEDKRQLDLMNFRIQIADALKLVNNTGTPKRGRPLEKYKPPAKKPKLNAERRPLDEVRMDNIGHLVTHDNNTLPTRCKDQGCKSKTHFMCRKCRVHLCVTLKNNCFENFHDRK
jgi:hypothetical protein